MPTQTATGGSSGAGKTLAITVAVAATLILIAYFIGHASGSAQLRAQKAGYEQKVAATEAKTRSVETQLAATQAQNTFLRAQADVYRVSVALDRRNFGTANDYVRKAAQTLQSLNAAQAGLDPAKVADIQSKLNAMQINVATDLQAQRDAVLAVAAEMDALMPQT